MSIWNTYPPDYRETEVQGILSAVQAGECASVIGLSGAGKSNLMGFIAHRADAFPHPNALIDCNRLRKKSSDDLFRLIRRELGDTITVEDEFNALDMLIDEQLNENGGKLTLLLDRFELLAEDHRTASNLRALRDAHKYQLTFVTATRRPIDPTSEIAELTFGHTIWLGPLSESDARWSINRYAKRANLDWDSQTAETIQKYTQGYPSLLRAVCEAIAAGSKLDHSALQGHPAVQQRVKEFWLDGPSESDIQKSGLRGLSLLDRPAGTKEFDRSQLTEKEYLLLQYFETNAGEVCSKDDLIQAVWPEDVIYERGIRDDSLAQLVRRLRVKIEPDPSNPQYIQTIPGRGYLFTGI